VLEVKIEIKIADVVIGVVLNSLGWGLAKPTNIERRTFAGCIEIRVGADAAVLALAVTVDIALDKGQQKQQRDHSNHL